MNTLLKPIMLNEQSYQVNVLHKILRVLGIAVNMEEVVAHKAGEDTLKNVRNLQRKLDVAINNDVLLDAESVSALTTLLKERELIAVGRSYGVSGIVSGQATSQKRRFKLLAFDLDLNAAAFYRSIPSVREIDKNGGFEFLGETETDTRGRYTLTFYDWQHRQPERNKADVVVYAIDDDNNTTAQTITGRSRLTHFDDYADQRRVNDLDVILEIAIETTEYADLMHELRLYLRENKTDFHTITQNIDQIAFCAKELEIEFSHLILAARADLLVHADPEKQLSHELLYGLGRQDIRLSWSVLYQKSPPELLRAIQGSSKEKIIGTFDSDEIIDFLEKLRACAVEQMLSDSPDINNTVNSMLVNALPEARQRSAYLRALQDFDGSDFSEFWRHYLPSRPEFKEKPELISKLLFTQQLTMLSGNHQALVKAIQVDRNMNSIDQLFDLKTDEWLAMIKNVGVPDFIQGTDEDERATNYAGHIERQLNAALPTRRIAKMIRDHQLPIEKNSTLKSMDAFLQNNPEFDFASSRVHDFKDQISRETNDFQEISGELMKIQRVFQLSPNPESMTHLLENGLHSAYAITNIPQNSFINNYGEHLGGSQTAFSIHQRASQISSRAEMNAMTMLEYSHMAAPAYALGKSGADKVKMTLENYLPNYADLFGSPDICECEHCRSVYSAAAYFVDLLRFLSRGKKNSLAKSPFDILVDRRPDLVHLPLTCENSNTPLPYIDLANEVMEFYAVNHSLSNFSGYDTGNSTAPELRANPQQFDLEAYRKLHKAVFPFDLPYHQPLDVIRTYYGHLNVTYSKVLQAIHPDPDSLSEKAIAAEALKLSEQEYAILTDTLYDGSPTNIALHEFYGYSSTTDLEKLSQVREFLYRTGISYIDMVALIETRCINPFKYTLDFLQAIFGYATIDASETYSRLEKIHANILEPANDPDIVDAINAYNLDRDSNISPADFGQWVDDHFGEFQQVITLFEPESKCNLDTTQLRTLQSIYENNSSSGISNADWTKLHRFLRLWRTVAWSIQELDLALSALGEIQISEITINRLASINGLMGSTKLPLDRLAIFWGDIDTNADKSYYKKLFLNRAVQEIDDAFKPDPWGNYLQDPTEKIGEHQSAILAAFKINESELAAILSVAEVIDNNVPRKLSLENDLLSLPNLSTLYRYVVMAKALKLKVADLCQLIGLFNVPAFSRWDIQQQHYVDISPEETFAFFQLFSSVKSAGYKSSQLAYIFQGSLSSNTSIGLVEENVWQTAKSIREQLFGIEHMYPEKTDAEITADMLSSTLTLTFQADVVAQLMAIIEDNAVFETITDSNLDITLPGELAEKYQYIKGSGRLISTGNMSDSEQSSLKTITNANINFQQAVDRLYKAPENYIQENFGAILNDVAGANAVLLNHPTQVNSSPFEEKLDYIYLRFIPHLKHKLRVDAIVQHIASLIGLSETATRLLIESDMDDLINDLSLYGFSATYFNDNVWSNSALQRIDKQIDFSWEHAAPDTLITAENFSVSWLAYIVAPASGEYTLLVDVSGVDEAFQLFIDQQLILEKTSGDPNTLWEIVTTFNASACHQLTLKYAETTQTAGIKLRWKTVTSAPELIPSNLIYPGSKVDAFVQKMSIYKRAGHFIAGFEINDIELNHFLNYSMNFDNIDFQSLTPSHWKRMNDYVSLRKGVPQNQASLIDVFSLANPPTSATLEDIIERLHQATNWDIGDLNFLIKQHFNFLPGDFKNEMAIQKIYRVVNLSATTGFSANTLATLGATTTDFDTLHAHAQFIKNQVKSKYTLSDWRELAGHLSDKLRQNQQQALVSYLLTIPAVKAKGIKDADGLFEYLLIDVQMSACMDTSRIVQANAAIQLFVNRCLLNLESELSGSLQKGVSPSAIDKDRWQWMQNYRVWEANRKVFLYPENWLEPEWRGDRSEFFKNLESYLVQNDITPRSVEQGFRNYLAQLNQVANLEVCGVHRENHDSGKLKFLHVFARTHNMPYQFFYRRWNQYGKWSAWESVQLDIKTVDQGHFSGVHLLPVVWKKQLYLFWPEFMELPDNKNNNANQSIDQAKNQEVSTLAGGKYWQVKLAWSDYRDGKWSSKQLSKEYGEVPNWYVEYVKTKSRVSFSAKVSTQGLKITLWNNQYMGVTSFEMTDIQSKIKVSSISAGPQVIHETSDDPARYYPDFIKRAKKQYAELILKDKLYLKNKVKHHLLFAEQSAYPENKNEPLFFFGDHQRSYFVRPVSIRSVQIIKAPEYYAPFLPEFIDDSGYEGQIIADGLGPDDYLPSRVLNKAISGDMANGDPADSIDSSLADSLTVPQQIEDSVQVRSAQSPANQAGRSLTEIDVAFNDSSIVQSAGITGLRGYRRGFEFHTFHHPFSSVFLENLNRGGLSRGNKLPQEFPAGLMESDTEIISDEGDVFENTYDPNFAQGLVKKHSHYSKPPNPRTAYKENVCFDVYGANSQYNWELFFHAPLYIATRLSKNGKYADAMQWFHYIFDPTTDALPAQGESEISRYWKVLPFKTTPEKNLKDWFEGLLPNNNPNSENAIIGEWRDNPFNPHLVASNRPLAYMKHVVVKYIENLLDWADFLFRQFTRESVYESLQLYIIANHILGPRPEFVPERGKIKAETYESLKDKWDDFSNALVELENIFPYSSEVNVSENSPGSNLLGIGPELYFCIPTNEKLLEYWDIVADRLFKIRHCQDINGVERKLALFAPPIDPAMLVRAISQGLSLGSILADLSSPPPIYRFGFLLQKANELCGDVKALGASLLAAIEKKDSEAMARLRASHETNVLEIVTAIREKAILEARSAKENLLKMRETAAIRVQYYNGLLGNTPSVIPGAPTISTSLNADSQLPSDTSIAEVKTTVDESLVDSDQTGVKLIAREQEDLDQSEIASDFQDAANATETIGKALYFIPSFTIATMPWGAGTASVIISGTSIGLATSAFAEGLRALSAMNLYDAQRAVKLAGYVRREQEWTFEANQAARQIIELDKQITSADIRVQIAQKELSNHQKQIDNAKTVEHFLKEKFTNQELYQWMKEHLFAVHKQSYNLAFEMAKKCEKAYQYEMGTKTADFIQYGYWDDARQGLLSGEKLQLSLRQLENAYLNDNRRELELSKSVSLALLNPLALLELKQTGKCLVSLPEELFDFDFQGHYFRRIKSVSVSIPCVVGPYTSINCSLRLTKNVIRIKTSMNLGGTYEHENDEGVWIDDMRFRESNVPVTSIAASNAQNDAGLFDFNFRDERYLPFEGAGVISDWVIELSTEKELRQFDYDTISDVILNLKYSAREAGGIFKTKTIQYMKAFITNAAETSKQPLMQMFNMRQEFPTEWYNFLHPVTNNSEQTLHFTPGKQRFPFFIQDRTINVMKMNVFVRCTQSVDYNMILSYTNFSQDVITSSELNVPQSPKYAGLHGTTININDAGLNLEEFDVSGEMQLKLKNNLVGDYLSLETNPDEIEDIFFVVHYQLVN